MLAALIWVYVMGAIAVFSGFVWLHVTDPIIAPNDMVDGGFIILVALMLGAGWPICAALALVLLGPGWLLVKLAERIRR